MLSKLCDQYEQVELFVQTDLMPELMAQANLAIGAGGTMAWERCVMNLPSLVAEIADNQKQQVLSLEKLGFAINLGRCKTDYVANLDAALNLIINQPSLLHEMTNKLQTLTSKIEPNAWKKVFL